MSFLGCSIRNPIVAFLVLAIYAFAYGCLNTYMPAMVTTLEKRFDLDTTRMGILLASNDIGYFLTIISVAYYGGHNKHVQCLVMSALGLGLSGFVFGLPFFIYGPRYSVEQLMNSNTTGENKGVGGAAMTYTEACRSLNATKKSVADDKGALAAVTVSEQTAAFVIQMLAGILNGMASSPFWNIGISFLDDITGKQSGGFIGLLLSIRCVAPIFGFIFAGFLNSMNESAAFFIKDYSAGQKDPFWIGAWWLGFMVLGIAVLCTAPFLAMFNTKALQKRIHDQQYHLRPTKANGANETIEMRKNDEDDDEEEAERLTKMEDASYVEDVYGEIEVEVEEPPERLSFKDMLQVYKKLWSKPPFFLNMIGKVLECFSNVAFHTFFPKFLELHFRMTATEANMTAAILLAGSAIAGVMSSGVINQRWPLSPKKSNFLHAVTNSAAAMLFPFLFFFVCEAKPMMGSPQHRLNLTCTTSSCECIPTYKPVCIGGENYFSACKAACKSFDAAQQIFRDCLCGSTTGSPGMCNDVCSLIYPYGILLFTQRVISIVAVVYFMKLNMSLTEKKNKPISLASVGFLYGITGITIPPLLGKLFDGACVMRNSRAGVSARSFCAIYDVDKLRKYVHWISFVPLVPSSVCYLLSWYFMKEDDEEEAKES